MTEVEHYPNGNIKRIKIKNEKGELHNENGPAYQKWYLNGQEEYRSYWINGQYHNENGPAFQAWHPNGQEDYREYYLNGKYHNDNGPARQEWIENGQECFREYWINGEELTEEEFHELKDTIEVKTNKKTVRISRQSAKELGVI